MWTKPQATEMRYGFEVTMYVMNRQFMGPAEKLGFFVTVYNPNDDCALSWDLTSIAYKNDLGAQSNPHNPLLY